MHAYSAEKKGEMELVFRQVIRLEQGHPRNFWKGFYPASGHSGPLRRRRSLPAWRADSALSAVLSAGLFPKHHVSLLNKAIVIEDCPSPGPGGLALRRDEVVVICSTVMKKKVITNYTGFVVSQPDAVGNIPFSAVVLDTDASHQAVAALISEGAPSTPTNRTTEQHAASPAPTCCDAAPPSAVQAAAAVPRAIPPLELLVSLHTPNGDFDRNVWLTKDDLVQSSTTVAELKSKIELKAKIPAIEQVLTFLTAVLGDESTVGEHDIHSMSELVCEYAAGTAGTTASTSTAAATGPAAEATATTAAAATAETVAAGPVSPGRTPVSPGRKSYGGRPTCTSRLSALCWHHR